MTFSKEELSKLFDIWEKDQAITIKGMNAFGEKFTTRGKITVDDKGNPGIYEEWIMIEFGKRTDKRKTGRDRADCYAPYRVEFNNKDSSFGAGLAILEIEDEQGEVIFSNSNAQELEKQTEVMRKKQEQDQKEHGTEFYGEDDAVTAQLRKLIGRPIHLDDESFVLLTIDGCNIVNGGTMLSVAKSTLTGGFHVGPKSGLFWEDVFTGEKKWEVNIPSETREIFHNRLMYNKANQANKNNEDPENEDE